MREKIQGEVWIDGIVEKDGSLTVVQVTKSLVPDLDQAAIVAAKQWKFRPGTRNGEPVRVRVQIIQTFRLHNGDEVSNGGEVRHVSYDSFMHQDVPARIQLFNTLTPENRVEIVKTQIERWLEANQGRLTKEQIAIMEENLAFLTADLYRLPRNPELMAKAKDLETRTAALLSREDMGQALTISGTYIPK